MIKLKNLLKEQPEEKPKQSQGDDAPKPQPVKTDIPNSPFEPDTNQVKNELEKIIKKIKTSEYVSNDERFKDLYGSIIKLIKKISETEDEV